MNQFSKTNPHTHARTHARTHAHTRTHTPRTHTHTHTHTHHAHTYAHTPHARTHARTHTHTMARHWKMQLSRVFLLPMQYWVYSIISYFTDLEKKKEKTKCNKNVLGTPYSYYLHLCDGWNWGQRARGCLLLAYVESICFTFSKKAFKMCTLGNFTTKVSQDKEMKKSDTFCIIWMCWWWCDSLLVLKCYAIFSRETDHNIILKASVHCIQCM